MSARVLRRTTKSGAVALEFALVALSFIGLVLLLVELGYLLYAQTAVDYAVKQVARQLLTGQQQTSVPPGSATTQTSFLTIFCAVMTTYLPCSGANVVITMQPLSGTQTFSQTPLTAAQVAAAIKGHSGPTVNPGNSGDLVLMNAYYTPNMPLWPLNVIMLTGTAAFLNEYAPS